jgi:hypothetical protein
MVSIRSIPVLAIGLAMLCWFQLAGGRVPYLSDAVLASLYLSAFGICALVAGSLPAAERDVLADRLAACMAGAALVSVPLAVLQWVGLLRLDMDMPVMGGRPVAHMEQANLLCSLLIQGLLGVWRLAERRRLGAPAALALGAPVLLTIVLTQSRVAWVVAVAISARMVSAGRLTRPAPHRIILASPPVRERTALWRGRSRIQSRIPFPAGEPFSDART